MALLEKRKQQVNLLGGAIRLIFGGSVEYCECFNKAGVDAAGL